MNKCIIPFLPTQTNDGSGLPGPAELVTLFDSTVTYGPKCLQHQNVDTYTVSIAPSTNATGNSLSGQWSADGGENWNTFYTSASNEPVGDGTTFTAQVHIGQFMDVRFRFQNGTDAQATKFDVAQCVSRSDSATSTL